MTENCPKSHCPAQACGGKLQRFDEQFGIGVEVLCLRACTGSRCWQTPTSSVQSWFGTDGLLVREAVG